MDDVRALQRQIGNRGLARLAARRTLARDVTIPPERTLRPAPRSQSAAADDPIAKVADVPHTAAQPDTTQQDKTPDPPILTAGPRHGVARPDESGLVTIAHDAITAWRDAAFQGLDEFLRVANVPDWESFALSVLGNVLWATACFVFAPETTIAVAATQFAISLTGIAVSSAASAPSTKEGFEALAKKQVRNMWTQLQNEVAGVTAYVNKLAAKEGWHDNRTRRELLTRLVRPEFVSTFAGGIPNLDANKVQDTIRNNLLIEVNELPNMGSRHEDSTALVTYYYDVSGAVDDSTTPSSVNRYYDEWRFKLSKVMVNLPSGGKTAVDDLAELGTLKPDKTRWHKRIVLTAPGRRFYTQENEWQIDLDGDNRVTVTWPSGIFLSMDDPDHWAETLLPQLWPPHGLPPDVEHFESGF